MPVLGSSLVAQVVLLLASLLPWVYLLWHLSYKENLMSQKPKNIYLAMYKGVVIEVGADTSYEAQKLAANLFRTKKTSNVTVVLVESEGIHVTTTLTN